MSEIPFELQHMELAHHYQKWIMDSLEPYLGQRILEVGAGIGNHSVWLPVREKLVITEADAGLFKILQGKLHNKFGADLRVTADLVDLSKDWTQKYANDQIDTIISFNVLEHVQDDQLALASFLKIFENSQGVRRVINFVPAHQWAHGSVDQAYGHYRRYSHKDFFRILHRLNSQPKKVYYRYFNLLGLAGWFLMGKVIRKKDLGPGSVKSFEKLCPWIRGVDDVLHKNLRLPWGQSLIFVMEY